VSKPKKPDWWEWIRERFGFSTDEKPAFEMPAPKRHRHRPKTDLYLWPDKDDRYWNSRPYRKEDWTDWFKFGYHPCKKGEIGGSGPRQKAVWQTEKTADGQEHFYVTCVKCAAVNDFTNHHIEKDGKVNPCIVCVKCHEHTWIRLEEWTGVEHKETKTAEDLAWEKKSEEWKKEFDKKYPNWGKDWKSGSSDLYGSWY